MNERDIFLKAVDINEDAGRAQFLDEACGEDAELRQRVDHLLQSHENAGSFLSVKDDDGSFAATVTGSPGEVALDDASLIDTDRVTVSAEGPGTTIGPYKLLQELGEGGMGTVYMAEQSEPVRRKIALKIIKPGMDSRQVIARFEAERQALALMDHNNIARVFDAGTTEHGRPYFVMELVKGVPITDYCDANKLDPLERLNLFLPVCRAVQHAHQKGIIHRDIKPSNVLVTLYDGQPVPKVIDFGIAKATGQQLTQKTMFTEIGQIVGTLEYMSPEQAEMNQIDVDTRSDIYSLGVLLYELLTGSPPITKQQLGKAGITEMLRTIREQEPPKPSTRLSESGDALPSISAVRKTEPGKLSKLVRGDLDWIVMKALEKDRNRRYESATGFAADIERFLNHEAVEACPPSAGYRLRKFVHRNKPAIATTAVIAIALVAGTVVSTWQAIRAVAAEELATERFENEQKARQGEALQRRLATEARKSAERGAYNANQILIQMNWEQVKIARMRHLLDAQLPELRGFEWHFWNNKLRRGSVALRVNDERGKVAGVAYRPDGKQIAVAAGRPGGSGEVTVWDVAARRKLISYGPIEHRVHQVAWDSSGRYLASASGEQPHDRGGDVIVWDMNTRNEVFRKRLKENVACVAFSPDGKRIAAGTWGFAAKFGDLKIWDVASQKVVFSQRQPERSFRSLSFSNDGKRLAVSNCGSYFSPDTRIEIWDITSQKVVTTIAVKLRGAASKRRYHIFDMTFNHDDSQIAAGVTPWNGEGGGIMIWDVADPERELPIPLDGHHGRITSLGFNRNGSRLVTSSLDGTIRIWDAVRGGEQLVLRGHTAGIWDVEFAPDGKHVASASSDGTVRIWDAETGQDTRTLKRKVAGELSMVTFDSTGQRIAGAHDKGRAIVWDTRTGNELFVLPRHTDHIFGVAFSPDDRFLATSGGAMNYQPGEVFLWDLDTKKFVKRFEGHTSAAGGLSFSPDGKWLASMAGMWGESGELKVWDVDTGKEAPLGLTGTAGAIGAVKFSPDGKYLVWGRLVLRDGVDLKDWKKEVDAGRAKGIVTVWDIAKRKPAYRFDKHAHNVIGVDFTSDSRYLATGSGDKTIKLWDLKSGELERTFEGHGGRVHSVAFSPDGTRLVSSGQDGTAKLWDVATGQELLTFKEHNTFVWSVDYHPDGRHIVSAGGDGAIKIWDGSPNPP